MTDWDEVVRKLREAEEALGDVTESCSEVHKRIQTARTNFQEARAIIEMDEVPSPN